MMHVKVIHRVKNRKCIIHFASRSCVLLFWQHYCVALEQWASAKLCDVVQGINYETFALGHFQQRAPPILRE